MVLPRILDRLSTTKRTYDSQSRFQIDLNTEKFLLNAVSFEKMNKIWTFVSGTPFVVTAPNKPYTHVVLIYWGISLIAALALSWFASKRIYKPISKIMDLFKDGKLNLRRLI